MPVTRRSFAASALGAAAALPAAGQPRRGYRIVPARSQETQAVLAARELARGLSGLFPGVPVGPGAPGLEIALEITAGDAQSYRIVRTKAGVRIRGGSPAALLYAVLDLLERQGIFFGIDGENYPQDAPAELVLPPVGREWEGKPRFAVRGLLPWPDFLNCVTVFNEEDFRAYFEAMMRMRFNVFGMHVYTGALQWAESYLSFEFAGAGHLAYLDNTATQRWNYLPQRTSRFGMGAAQFYDGETFGSDASRFGRDNWEIASRTRELLAKSLAHARRLGLRTGLGFEPYQIPDEILRALPPEVKPPAPPDGKQTGPRFDIESRTAKKMLEARLGQMLEAYPDLDYVWLWEDEAMNWDSRKTGQPLSTTPFLQAHDFLKRNAPKKRLVLSGWGGVARHFEYFHQNLPGDVVFSCLSDSLGWDPVHEVYAKLEGRERWPIPWLEDDPGMWLPQFHAYRFQRDLDLAEQYGCQGMIGIHWRHRIVDPTAAYMARASWNKGLHPELHYSAYARTQAAPPRAPKLAAALNAADRDRKLLSTGTREMKDGHVVIREFSGDYNEGFTFWNKHAVDPHIAASQKQTADELAALLGEASTPAEKERIAYLSKHVGFLVPYAEAWTLAQRIQAVLDTKDKARVRDEAVPLWLKLAPQVREAMLLFQAIVATRNDLGTLASLQNKFVRLALYRLPLSIEEQLGELPAEMEAARREALKPPENEEPRLIVPARPTVLGAKDAVRVLAIVTGPKAPQNVLLHTRQHGAWSFRPMKLAGRRTYEAQLAGPVTDYYVSAAVAGQPLQAPLGAPRKTYRITQI